jgi:hypothetical protein
MTSILTPSHSVSSVSQQAFNYRHLQEQSFTLGGSSSAASQQRDEIKPDLLRFFFSSWAFLKSGAISSNSISSSVKDLQNIRDRKIYLEETSTVFAIDALLQYVASLYSLRDSRKVLRFLQENQFLILLLIEARGYIAKYFSGSMVVLELETDPDEPHSQQLVAAIVTNSSTDQAYQALKQLDENWWLHALERTRMKLCITVEFR